MSVFLYIIESANYEQSSLVFEDKFVSSSEEKINDDFIDYSPMRQLIDDLAKKYTKNIYVLFIDKQYLCKYYYTEEGKLEKEMIDSYKSFCDYYPADWHDFLSADGNNFNSSDEHIFISRKSFLNVYDFTNHLEISIQPNFYFLWNMTDVNQIDNARSYYNIFSSTDKDKQIDSRGNKMYQPADDELYLNWIVEQGVTQVTEMIRAGFLKRERFVQAEIDPWVTNVESPFSKGVIVEYDLILENPKTQFEAVFKGQSAQKCFNELTDYRYILTDYMCRCLSKYGLEFEKIPSIYGNCQTVNFNFLLR